MEPPPTPFHLSHTGMSGAAVGQLLEQTGISDAFYGVFSALELGAGSPRLRSARPLHILIVNVGAHFVTLVVRSGQCAIYVDSFGLPILHPGVRSYLRRVAPGLPVYYNKKRIQSASSVHCGLYAALFALHYDGRRRRRGEGLRFAARAASGENDALCVRYLKELALPSA